MWQRLERAAAQIFSSNQARQPDQTDRDACYARQGGEGVLPPEPSDEAIDAFYSRLAHPIFDRDAAANLLRHAYKVDAHPLGEPVPGPRPGMIEGRWVWLNGHYDEHPRTDTVVPSFGSQRMAPGYVVAHWMDGEPAWYRVIDKGDGSKRYALEFCEIVMPPREMRKSEAGNG